MRIFLAAVWFLALVPRMDTAAHLSTMEELSEDTDKAVQALAVGALRRMLTVQTGALRQCATHRRPHWQGRVNVTTLALVDLGETP